MNTETTIKRLLEILLDGNEDQEVWIQKRWKGLEQTEEYEWHIQNGDCFSTSELVTKLEGMGDEFQTT